MLSEVGDLLLEAPERGGRHRVTQGVSPGRTFVDLLALGVRVRLEADTPGKLEALVERVPCGWVDNRVPAGEVDCRLRWVRPRSCRPQRLLLNGKAVVTARRPGDLLDRFEHELQAAVAARTRSVVLHAGAVVYRGRAVLLPGHSFCGKSTLVQALVAAGAVYYSDDLAPIDTKGRVHAVPKRLALRQGASHVASINASDLGWHAGCIPRLISLAVLTRYRPAAIFAPRRLSTGEGALALFRHAVSAEAAPERAFRVLTGLAAKVPILTTDRGGAEETVAAILAILEHGPMEGR